MANIRKRLDYDPEESSFAYFEGLEKAPVETVVKFSESPGRQCRKMKTQDIFGSLTKAHREPDFMHEARTSDFTTSYRDSYVPGQSDKAARLPKGWHNRSDNVLSDQMGRPFEGQTETREKYQGFKVQFE